MPEINLNLNAKKHYDIIVAGGGVAGCAAAIQAAELGHSVLLLEKKCRLGGLAAGGLVNFMEPLCDGKGNIVMKGFAEKLTRQLLEFGYNTLPDVWKDNRQIPDEKSNRFVTFYSASGFSLLLLDEIRRSGADILYDCVVTDVVVENKLCRGVLIYGKAGFEYYGCDMLIDATGDCDALRQAGVPTVKGKNYHSYYGHIVTLDKCRKAIDNNDIFHIYSWITGGDANLYGSNQPEDVPLWSGLSPEEVTDYLIRCQNAVYDKFRNIGNSTADIAAIPDMPQFRTTCHIRGDYTFTEKDEFVHFEDSVCLTNDFDRKGRLYEIPLRCLTDKSYPNIITAGRSVSAEGYGWDIVRVIPPAIITGQVSAIVCSRAIRENKPVTGTDIKSLQSEIEKNNIIVHF